MSEYKIDPLEPVFDLNLKTLYLFDDPQIGHSLRVFFRVWDGTFANLTIASFRNLPFDWLAEL